MFKIKKINFLKLVGISTMLICSSAFSGSFYQKYTVENAPESIWWGGGSGGSFSILDGYSGWTSSGSKSLYITADANDWNGYGTTFTIPNGGMSSFHGCRASVMYKGYGGSLEMLNPATWYYQGPIKYTSNTGSTFKRATVYQYNSGFAESTQSYVRYTVSNSKYVVTDDYDYYCALVH